MRSDSRRTKIFYSRSSLGLWFHGIGDGLEYNPFTFDIRQKEMYTIPARQNH